MRCFWNGLAGRASGEQTLLCGMKMGEGLLWRPNESKIQKVLCPVGWQGCHLGGVATSALGKKKEPRNGRNLPSPTSSLPS